MARNPPRLGDPKKVLEVTLGARAEEVAADVVVTPFVPLKAFARHVDEGSLRELCPLFFFKGFTATRRGHPVTVLLSGVGPSRVGDLVSLLALTGVERLLFAGAVGGLAPELSIGTFFLPDEAADGEGYTRYLLRPFAEVVAGAARVRCAGGLEEALLGHLATRGVAARRGRVFTVGSIAAESPENLAHLARAGFDALEMELSAFYAAAAHHAIQAAALTYVSDLPLASSLWSEKGEEEEGALRAAYRALPELCLDFFAGAG